MAFILVAADGSEGSEAAIRLTSSIRWPAGTAVGVATVVPHLRELLGVAYAPVVPMNADAVEEAELRRAEETMSAAADRVRSAGCSVHSWLLRGRPADVIVALARRFSSDMIIMGSRGLGTFQAALLGSVSSEVVDRAPCPVLIARGTQLGATLIGDDGSTEAAAARSWIAQRPHLLGTSVRLVGVAPDAALWPDSLLPLDAASADVMLDAHDDVRSALTELLETNARGLRETGIAATSE